MKNFELRYPVQGTAALQPNAVEPCMRRARIIAFPEAIACESKSGTDFANALRYGTAQGAPFGRIQRWQAVVCGCVFAAAALGSILVGL